MNQIRTYSLVVLIRIIFWTIFIISLTTFFNVEAQNDSIPISHRPAQVTFVYPLGSNGVHSYHFVNNFSLNILAGVSAGVNGLEIGGISNISKGRTNGAQFAGVINVNKDFLSGLQVGGISNINGGGVKGLQLAGISNTTGDDVHGTQVAGILNTTKGNMKGLQVGLINVVSKKHNGTQVGLINYAKRVNGLQFGLINIADSIGKGAGIGLVSYYKNGYHKFELEWNETFYLNTTFKSGVEKFYMIYTVGFKSKNNKLFWSPGIGFGSLFKFSESTSMNLDFISRQVNEDEWWTDELNLLNTMKINFTLHFTDQLSVFAGPSFNVVVSGIEDVEGSIIGDSFSPWDFYDDTGSRNRTKMYIGFNAGLRF